MRALVVLLAACGGGGDVTTLEGIYRVTRAVGDIGTCDTNEEIAGFPPYLLFRDTTFDGVAVYEYDGCPDATGVGCSFRDRLLEPTDDGWRRTSPGTQGSNTSCRLLYTKLSATLDDAIPTGLVIDHHEYVLETSDAPCTLDEAQRLGDAMPCFADELVEATKL